jgi:hypothetical protein
MAEGTVIFERTETIPPTATEVTLQFRLVDGAFVPALLFNHGKVAFVLRIEHDDPQVREQIRKLITTVKVVPDW